ncbi:hypothetical protein B0H11DRAFT_1914593 [Mycena galericulata]|nr:hypothetical protein B0H11DRAFT_1914593 [Mycena galericulata]
MFSPRSLFTSVTQLKPWVHTLKPEISEFFMDFLSESLRYHSVVFRTLNGSTPCISPGSAPGTEAEVSSISWKLHYSASECFNDEGAVLCEERTNLKNALPSGLGLNRTNSFESLHTIFHKFLQRWIYLIFRASYKTVRVGGLDHDSELLLALASGYTCKLARSQYDAHAQIRCACVRATREVFKADESAAIREDADACTKCMCMYERTLRELEKGTVYAGRLRPAAPKICGLSPAVGHATECQPLAAEVPGDSCKRCSRVKIKKLDLMDPGHTKLNDLNLPPWETDLKSRLNLILVPRLYGVSRGLYAGCGTISNRPFLHPMIPSTISRVGATESRRPRREFIESNELFTSCAPPLKTLDSNPVDHLASLKIFTLRKQGPLLAVLKDLGSFYEDPIDLTVALKTYS